MALRIKGLRGRWVEVATEREIVNAGLRMGLTAT